MVPPSTAAPVDAPAPPAEEEEDEDEEAKAAIDRVWEMPHRRRTIRAARVLQRPSPRLQPRAGFGILPDDSEETEEDTGSPIADEEPFETPTTKATHRRRTAHHPSLTAVDDRLEHAIFEARSNMHAADDRGSENNPSDSRERPPAQAAKGHEALQQRRAQLHAQEVPCCSGLEEVSIAYTHGKDNGDYGTGGCSNGGGSIDPGCDGSKADSINDTSNHRDDEDVGISMSATCNIPVAGGLHREPAAMAPAPAGRSSKEGGDEQLGMNVGFGSIDKEGESVGGGPRVGVCGHAEDSARDPSSRACD